MKREMRMLASRVQPEPAGGFGRGVARPDPSLGKNRRAQDDAVGMS